MSNQWNSYQTNRLNKFVKDFLTCVVRYRNYKTNLDWQQGVQNQPNSFCNEFNSRRYDHDMRNQGMQWRQYRRPEENPNNFSSVNCNRDKSSRSGSQAVRNDQHVGNAYSYTQNTKVDKLENSPREENPNNFSPVNCNWDKSFRSGTQAVRNGQYVGNAYNYTQNTKVDKLENTPHMQNKLKEQESSKITTGNAYNNTKNTKRDQLEITPNSQKELKQQQPSKITTDVQKRKQTEELRNRVSLTPYKNREFANAKRCVQRLGKLNYDTLEEKQRFSLNRARQIMAQHKKARNRKNNSNAIY